MTRPLRYLFLVPSGILRVQLMDRRAAFEFADRKGCEYFTEGLADGSTLHFDWDGKDWEYHAYHPAPRFPGGPRPPIVFVNRFEYSGVN